MMRTTVQLDEHNIHVGCCLFSHNHKFTNQQKQQVLSKVDTVVRFVESQCVNLLDKEEKKTKHTRMYAQLCSSTNVIFTSVVVYSRTTRT